MNIQAIMLKRNRDLIEMRHRYSLQSYCSDQQIDFKRYTREIANSRMRRGIRKNIEYGKD